MLCLPRWTVADWQKVLKDEQMSRLLPASLQVTSRRDMDEGVLELNDEVILPWFHEVHLWTFVNCQNSSRMEWEVCDILPKANFTPSWSLESSLYLLHFPQLEAWEQGQGAGWMLVPDGPKVHSTFSELPLCHQPILGSAAWVGGLSCSLSQVFLGHKFLSLSWVWNIPSCLKAKYISALEPGLSSGCRGTACHHPEEKIWNGFLWISSSLQWAMPPIFWPLPFKIF